VGRQSTIDRLPQAAREALNAWLRDPAITQEQATERVNDLLDELGLPEHQVSRHAVNRYDLKMRDVGQRLRESRQVAEAWIAKLGAAPQGQLGHLVNEVARTLAFDVSMVLADGELDAKKIPFVMKALKDLALTMQRLEHAANMGVEREREIREASLEEAAERIDSAAQTRGLSAEDAKFWREQVLMGM
jgi:hypothetical protein